ncbi:MAG: response regulator [Phycisphaeraceae bacterium]|nr:MAG: response regulator [Phycisphaeraceae bacterium]
MPGDVRHPLEEKATNARYRLALDHTAIVAITDHRGTITYVNDKFCKISGYERGELLGRNHRVLSSGQHPKSFFTEMFRVIAKGGVWRGDICNRAKNGSLYWVDTTIVPAIGEDGRVDAYIAIRSDITERKLREQSSVDAYEHIKELCNLKTEFFANISHEIRTPLTAILGYTELLFDDAIDPAERSAHLNTIRRNGEHLLRMVNDLLDATKIEAQGLGVELVDTDTVEAVVEVIASLQIRADGKGLPIALEFETPIPPTIFTDPVRLRQILTNLLGNAIKFTEVGRVRVAVGLEHRGGVPMLRVEVADTGIGIKPETIGRLFEPFQQADASTTRKYGGTGLGLCISRRLATLLGGGITVRSTPGVGSSFVLHVPTGPLGHDGLLGADEAHQRARRYHNTLRGVETPSPNEHPLHDRSILLVEDGPDNQRLLAHFLRNGGAAVTVAEDGQVALDLVERGVTFDAILMDVHMPRMDGIEATQRIRALGVATPVIALTAHASGEDCDRCLAAGCDDYLTKPITCDALLGTLARWIDARDRDAA